MRADSEQWKSSEVARLLALVETERRYWQEIVAAAPVPLAIVDTELELAMVNREFRRRFNLGGEDLGKTRITDLIASSDLESRIREVFASGNSQTGFRQEIHEGGRARPVKVSVVRIRGWQDGADEEVLVAVEEYAAAAAGPAPASHRSIISAVAAAVAATHPQAPTAGVLGEALPAAASTPMVTGPARRTTDYLDAVVWEMDPETRRFTSVSARAAEMLGVRREDWRSPAELSQTTVQSEDREAYLDFYAADFSERESGSLEYRIRAGAGSLRWMRDSVRYVRPEGGRPARLAGITQDVTGMRAEERVRAEDAKREALERLAARVAHVANNLLMIVAGYSEDLMGTFAPSDPRRGDIEEIQRSAQRLARLSTQLNAIALPSRYEPGEVELSEWASACAARLRTELAGFAAVELSPPARALWARVNPQVLDHVFREAVRLLRPAFTARSQVVLAPGATEDPGVVEIVLHLRGVALEPALRERFFEPFAGPKEQGQDPPLGLAAWMKPLRLGGGSALLSGEPGEDARFVVRLARAGKAAPGPGTAAAALTILVVEDEQAIRTVLCRALEREGFSTLQATTTEEGLELLQKPGRAIHLLITDIQVPRKNGLELARQAAALRPGLPVLFMSGHSGEVQIDPQALPPGTAFLSKPFSVQALVEQVREMARGRGSAAGV
jgi:PAS domain S-box-containing protein